MAAPSPSFRPARSLTLALSIVLGLVALLNLAFAFVAGWMIYVFHALGSQMPLAEIPFIFIGHWLGWDQASSAVGFFLPVLWPWRALAVVTANILFVIWLYRAHRNLSALGVENLRYRSHWAITGYFVPFLNLARPFQMVREVWKGSSGAAPEQPTAALVRVWWELTLLAAILGELTSFIESNHRVEAVGVVVAGYLTAATVMVLQLTLVRRIHRGQLVRAREAAPAGAPAVWTSPMVDVGAVAGVVLVAALLYWQAGNVLDAALERWMERMEATRSDPPPPPLPPPGPSSDAGTTVPPPASKMVVPKEFVGPVKTGEAIEGGVPGGVEGGVVGGVLGGISPSEPATQRQSAPRRIRISPGGLNRISGSPPKYPELARQARIQGTVVLEVVIATDGRVSNARVLSGNSLLMSAAIEAVKDWRYQPTLLNGEPVEVMTTVSVVFRLD